MTKLSKIFEDVEVFTNRQQFFIDKLDEHLFKTKGEVDERIQPLIDEICNEALKHNDIDTALNFSNGIFDNLYEQEGLLRKGLKLAGKGLGKVAKMATRKIASRTFFLVKGAIINWIKQVSKAEKKLETITAKKRTSTLSSSYQYDVGKENYIFEGVIGNSMVDKIATDLISGTSISKAPTGSKNPLLSTYTVNHVGLKNVLLVGNDEKEFITYDGKNVFMIVLDKNKKILDLAKTLLNKMREKPSSGLSGDDETLSNKNMQEFSNIITTASKGAKIKITPDGVSFDGTIGKSTSSSALPPPSDSSSTVTSDVMGDEDDLMFTNDKEERRKVLLDAINDPRIRKGIVVYDDEGKISHTGAENFYHRMNTKSNIVWGDFLKFAHTHDYRIPKILSSIRQSDFTKQSDYLCYLANVLPLIIILQKSKKSAEYDSNDYNNYLKEVLKAAKELSIFVNRKIGDTFYDSDSDEISKKTKVD